MRDFGSSLSGCEHITFHDGEGLARRAVDYLTVELINLVYDDPCEDSEAVYRERSEQCNKVRQVINVYWPNIDPEQPDALVIWPSPDARTKGRKARTAMRIGRALRRMFPALTAVEVEELTDKVKRQFASKTYTLHKSKDADWFVHAYTHEQSTNSNLTTTTFRKHSANSCMRYTFNSQPRHPVEAYASGDFEVIWLEDEEGKIAARCVVAVAEAGSKLRIPVPSAVYAVSEPAMDKFIELTGIDPDEDYSRNWVGCRLKALPHNGGYQAPYLDLSPRYLELSDCEEYLQITRNGNIDANQYSGILYDHESYVCTACGCRAHENDVYYAYDESYCETCYSERFTHCYHCHEATSREETHEVAIGRSSGGVILEETWCQYCVDHDAAETFDGVLWHIDEVITTFDGEYVDQVTAEMEYFQDHLDGEYYPCSLAQSLEDGDLATLENIAEFNSRNSTYRYVYEATQQVWVLEAAIKEEQEVA